MRSPSLASPFHWTGRWAGSRNCGRAMRVTRGSRRMSMRMGSGLGRRAVGQLQPALRVPPALLDAPQPARDVVRERDRALADLEPADGRLAGGKDNAGVQDAEGVEGALHLGEQRHDLLAVDPGEDPGAKPA